MPYAADPRHTNALSLRVRQHPLQRYADAVLVRARGRRVLSQVRCRVAGNNDRDSGRSPYQLHATTPHTTKQSVARVSALLIGRVCVCLSDPARCNPVQPTRSFDDIASEAAMNPCQVVQADDLGKACTSIDVNNSRTGLPVLLKGFGVSNTAAAQLALMLERYETTRITSNLTANRTTTSPSGAGTSGRRLASVSGGGVVRVAVYTCPGGEEACPNDGTDGIPLCAQPYQGPMCSQCSVGYSLG